jgi:hypothetical protein
LGICCCLLAGWGVEVPNLKSVSGSGWRVASRQPIKSMGTSLGLLLAFRGASGVAPSGMRRLTIVWCSMSLVAMTEGVLAFVTLDSIKEVVRPRTQDVEGLGALRFRLYRRIGCIRRSRAVAQSPGLSVSQPRASNKTVASAEPPSWSRRV